MMNLFASNNNEVTVGAKGLEATARLTMIAANVASGILKGIEKNETDETKAAVQASMQSHDAMDKLINDECDLAGVNVEFLKDLSDDELDRMIKSQQSKRSRSKSKVMTLENYKSMMIGAIAEGLLRIVTGKGKSSVGFSNRTSEVVFSETDLDRLSMDQEELRKAIRNIQSKKSIMKSKANYDESSDRWQQLLVAEEQLKSIRTTSAPIVKIVDEKSSKINELLADVDVEKLKAGDSKDLLATIKQLLG